MADIEHVKVIIDEINKDSSDDIQDAGNLPVKKRGGKRPGAGRKPKADGNNVRIQEAKRNKREAKQYFLQRVKDNVDTLFSAQLALAKGEQHLFVKYHTGEGKDRRANIDIVTDPSLIARYLSDDGYTLNQEDDDEYYYIATKPANNQAIDSLLNRAFGKAPEKLEIEGGFFKANSLEIKVVEPRKIDDVEEAVVIDATTTESDHSSTEHETEPRP